MSRTKRISDSQLLEQALCVISRLGPDTFTLADVAEAVGLAPATLLQRFGSKQGLILAALKQGNDDLTLEAYAATAAPREALVGLLSRLPENWGSRQEVADSLRMLRLDIVDPELHPIVRERFAKRRALIALLLEKLAPKLSEDDRLAAAWELDAYAHGLAIQWALSGTGELRDWLVAGLQRHRLLS